MTGLCHAPLKLSREIISRVARDFQIDGAVFFAPVGCKHGCAMIRTMRDALKITRDIPTLVLDGDLLDPSLLFIEEMKTKFEEFFEIIDQHKTL